MDQTAMKRDTHEQFLMNAYAGLVLRGFDKLRDIQDPILREVWRRGKAALLSTHKKVKP
jgi:hypothetical protein